MNGNEEIVIFFDGKRNFLFNRSHLTQDMLIPNTELKLQIEEFVRSQQSRKRSAAVSEIGEADGADDMAE